MINVNTKSGIIVSASMAIVATQAMAYFAGAGKDSRAVEASHSDNEHLRNAVKAAVAKRDVRMAINSAFDALASSFGDADGDSLAKKYFPDGNVRLAQTNDFTNGVANCYSNCHSACHDACHGSRGWR
jgi:hypothetical protein